MPHPLVHRLNQVLIRIAGAALCGMVLLSCGNMLLRLLGSPVKGTYELMGFSGAVLAAFALGTTQRQGGHIEVDLLGAVLPASVNRWLRIAANLASTAFFGLICWRLLVLALSLKQSGEVSETLHLPYYPVVLAVALGIFGLILILLHQILDLVHGRT
jgi:TRAP-type C4-dicarboxylate transport system permease small subunit